MKTLFRGSVAAGETRERRQLDAGLATAGDDNSCTRSPSAAVKVLGEEPARRRQLGRLPTVGMSNSTNLNPMTAFRWRI